MRAARFLIVSAMLSTSACGHRTVEVQNGNPAMAGHWMGNFSRPMSGMTITGNAMVMPANNDPNSTTASVTIQGGHRNGTHLWHIHRGACGTNGGIVGSMAMYPPLQTDANGNGSVTATLPFATPMSGEYSVNIHHSPGDMTVVACTNLGM